MKKCIFLVFIVFLVFCFFHFSYSCLNYLTYLHYKEQQGQHMVYYWRRKIKQMLSKESYHIICWLKRNSPRISLSQLSVSNIVRENSLWEGKILDEIINQSKILFITLTRSHYLKPWMTLKMFSAFVFLGKHNLKNKIKEIKLSKCSFWECLCKIFSFLFLVRKYDMQ